VPAFDRLAGRQAGAGDSAAGMTVGGQRTMPAARRFGRCRRRRLLCCRPRAAAGVDVVAQSSLCCADVATSSSLFFAVTLCLSLVASLTVVDDVTLSHTPGTATPHDTMRLWRGVVRRNADIR